MSLSISISSITDTSFRATVSTSGSVAMDHYWYLDGQQMTIVSTAQGVTGSYCTFTGLSPGTSYRVSVRVFAYNPWRELDNGSATATTTGSSKKRPSDFYWSTVGSSGTALSITARDWNNFIGRIEDFADYKDVRLNSSDLSSAYASSGGTMFAYQANAARNLIAQMSPPTSVPSRVNTGDIIRAQFFLDLRSSLNSIR